jgi:hypothetical protein
MQFDLSLYDYDFNHRDLSAAALKDGAFLYRIVSHLHCDKDKVLNGEGALLGRGRFHRYQRATYCANNVFVCIAEVLYHMNRQVLDGIEKGDGASELLSKIQDERTLTIMAVDEIKTFVYADSREAASVYNARHITGPSITCPDATYDPLNQFSEAVRDDGKYGIFYPSARHSEGIAFVLFQDGTARIKTGFFEKLRIKLRLIGESQDRSRMPPDRFGIFEEKLHATMGYYEFLDPSKLARLDGKNQLNPTNLPVQGYVDFVRRRYISYPDDAYMD